MSPRTHSRPTTGRKIKQAGIKKTRGPYRKGGAAGRARLPYTKKTQPRKMSVTSSEDSDEALAEMQGEAGHGDDDGDAEDESDVSAPSYASRKNIKAGPESDEEIKEPMMFDSEEEKEAWFGDSEDDDEIYEGVDDISDDEDVSAPVEEEFLAAQFYDHPDVAANFLGDLDGYSIFGFENDVDRHSFSSSSDSSDEVVAERRVHFESDVEDFPLNAESPEMTALMTRALPAPFSKEELRESSQNEELSAAHRAFLGDPDEDSDLTDEELPAEAHTASPSALQNDVPFEDEERTMSPSSPKKDKKEKKQVNRRRGPTLGVFEFDGDKPWAVLDPSGTKVHIAPAPDTNRHDWLERKAQHVMNQLLGIGSAESSPRGSLATLLDDSDRSVSSSQENADAMIYGGANVMMAGLNSGSQHGHATGPPEAFYPPSGQFMGDFLLADDDLDLDDDDRRDPTGEGRLNIADFIICGGDSDDEGENGEESIPASPTRPPAGLPAVGLSTPTHKKADSWSHLNSDNVMSFRRNADPSSASRNQPWNFDLAPSTPGPNFPSSPIPRKRKARSPPYQGEHYRDVTVVERKLITPKPKRRRANTTL